jgi:DNA-directed RNA polymerase subunit alpha
MNYIPLPSGLNIIDKDDKNTTVIIEPCYPGYGTTVGNALRRVLLSSIPGAAITSFKVKNILHEFSTLENVKEDVVEMILNIKKLRFKIFTDEVVLVKLSTKGKKVVSGADIEKNASIEIINPEQMICTLTSKEAEINMEFKVRRGFGYVTVEEREKEKMDVGEIMIDSLYSPIVNVGIDLENVRVGDITNYDKLILSITTDGSILGSQAVKIAADILVKHFSLFNHTEESAEIENEKITESENLSINEELAPLPKKRGRKPKL